MTGLEREALTERFGARLAPDVRMIDDGTAPSMVAASISLALGIAGFAVATALGTVAIVRTRA